MPPRSPRTRRARRVPRSTRGRGARRGAHRAHRRIVRVALYRTLAMDPWRARIPWDRVHLWVGRRALRAAGPPRSCANIAFAILLRQSAGWASPLGAGRRRDGRDAAANRARPYRPRTSIRSPSRKRSAGTRTGVGGGALRRRVARTRSRQRRADAAVRRRAARGWAATGTSCRSSRIHRRSTRMRRSRCRSRRRPTSRRTSRGSR
jgi:hypothetical protein